MKKLIIIVLLVVPTMQLAQAALPALLWTAVKELAIDTAIDAVQDLFKESVKPEEVAKLRQRIVKVETQLAMSKSQSNYPSIEEFNTVKQLVASVNNMVNKMDQRLGSVETRLSQVEQELISLRQAWLNVSKGEAVEINKPLDFKINYVYRSGGKGNLKTLTDGGVLQSGDYYKIIFTPAEKCYMYIFQLDSANKLFRLFPMQSFGGVTVNNSNPVIGGNTYHIPAKHKSFELDTQIGPETIYFVATRQADIVLENQYQALQNAQQQQNTTLVQLVQNQTKQVMRAKKGLSAIKDDPNNNTATWQEEGQQFSILQKTLQDMCNGCVDILTFQHQ